MNEKAKKRKNNEIGYFSSIDNLKCDANDLEKLNFIEKDFYEVPLNNCLKFLTDVLNNQSLSSQECYTTYVVRATVKCCVRDQFIRRQFLHSLNHFYLLHVCHSVIATQFNPAINQLNS